MKESKSIVLSLSIKIIVIVMLAFVIGVFLVNDIIIYLKGLMLGTIFTILRLKLMENSFKSSIMKEPHKAITHARGNYLIRYFLTIVVLLVGILEPSVSIIGVVIGLIAMKLAAYWQGFIEKPTPKDGSVEFITWEDDEEPSDF